MEEPFDFTQPTQPFEDATQATQDDTSQVASLQKPVGKLVWKRGAQISGNVDHDIFLDTPVVIGRHRSCDIPVTSSVSSNRHCTIKATVDVDPKKYLVVCEDLSSNGTFWNSKKIGKGKSVMLTHGDVIEIKRGYYFTYLSLSSKRDKSRDTESLDSKYQITDTILGTGTFAQIRLACRKDTGKQMAVKIMERRDFSMNGTASGGTNYIHEVSILHAIRHANIVRVYDVFETERHVYIFMPMLRGGDLFDYVSDNGRLDEDEAKFILYQVLLALKYLHDHGVTHRDLKPENTLLVSKEPYSQVMLTDFGMAKVTGQQQQRMNTMCGTFQYIAPEMLVPGIRPGQALDGGYTKKVDCWSLGVMTYAVVSGLMPFSDNDVGPKVLFAQIKSGHVDFTPGCWRTISIECQSFIRKLLQVDPEQRMSVDQALKHPWIARDEPRLAKLYAQTHRNAETGSPEERSPSPTNDDSDSRGSKRSVDSVQPLAPAAPQPEEEAAGSAIPMGPPPAKRQR
ncbi:hypothetical protein H4S01_001455 [Coemansia sp. RSA 2610]|nr:hypothetical protein H4S01_001455 [Coemansia sp. RSA 2610]